MASGKIRVACSPLWPPVAPVVVDLVAGEDQGPLHLLVGHPPVAAVDVQVGAAVLEEDADRLRLVLADQRRIDVPAAQADVGADRAEDAAERVGPLPGRGERGDRPAAGPGDAAVVAVAREPDRPPVGGLLRLDLGQELLEQEPGVVVAQPVVLVAAIEPVHRLAVGALTRPGVTKTPMVTGISFLCDQLVEDLGRLVLHAVLADEQAGRLGRVILLGHVDPVVAHRAGEDLALVERVLGDLALRRRAGRLGVVGAGGTAVEGEEQSQEDGEEARLDSRHGGVLARCRGGHPSSPAQEVILAEPRGGRQEGLGGYDGGSGRVRASDRRPSPD